jgi:LPXTG-motif cell wall-anchored protein
MARKLIAGVILASALTVGVALPASADPTCYTGCAPQPPGLLGSGPGGPGTAPSGVTVPTPTVPVPAPSQFAPPPGGLPVTGADVGESVSIGLVLVVAGGALVRVKRRRAPASR